MRRRREFKSFADFLGVLSEGEEFESSYFFVVDAGAGYSIREMRGRLRELRAGLNVQGEAQELVDLAQRVDVCLLNSDKPVFYFRNITSWYQIDDVLARITGSSSVSAFTGVRLYFADNPLMLLLADINKQIDYVNAYRNVNLIPPDNEGAFDATPWVPKTREQVLKERVGFTLAMTEMFQLASKVEGVTVDFSRTFFGERQRKAIEVCAGDCRGLKRLVVNFGDTGRSGSDDGVCVFEQVTSGRAGIFAPLAPPAPAAEPPAPAAPPAP